jgi:hypothetical protein
MHDDHIDGSQGPGLTEAAIAVAQSREVAERLWAEIGRLLTAGSASRPSGITGR